MWNLILNGIVAVVISITLYKIISGFLYDVTLRRLTKASFNLSLLDFIDLSLAYFIAMLSFLLINLYFKKYISFTSEESIVITGLILVYVGRIITKHQGMVFGKLHFSAILITSSILLIIDFIRIGKFTPSVIISNFSPYTISNIYDTSINITINYIDFLYDGERFDQKLLLISFVGILFLSTIGEFCLSKWPPNPKSLMVIADKFPSDFRVITGVMGKDNKIDQTINSMFEGNILFVRCNTKSLRFIELLKEPLEIQYELNSKSEDKKTLDYRITKAPEEKARKDYKKLLQNIPASPYKIYVRLIRDEDRLLKDFRSNYANRERILANLVSRGIIVCKEIYLGDIIFLITEDDNKFKKLLFLVKDKSNFGGRVGLYTEQPYLIDIFEHNFLIAWDKKKIM